MALDLTFQSLDESLERFYNRTLKTRCEDRRIPVAIVPTLENEIWEPNGIHFPVRTINEKILLGVISWYMPKDIACLTNLWLEEHWGAEFKEVKIAILNSKQTALGYLLVNDRWNNNDFFGNILKEQTCKNILRFSFRRRNNRKVSKGVFRRGYNDKGTLRLQHDVQGYNFRKFKTVAQKLQEEEEQTQKIFDLFDLIYVRLEEEGIA